MSHELKGSLNNALNLNGSMNSSGNLRGMFQLGGGGGGTTDYEDLSNKPSINGHTLEGDSSTADLQLDYDDLLNKPVIPDMSGYYDKTETDALLADKANTADLATVATTGDYDDLINKPVIPDVSNYYTKSETNSLLADKADTADLATVATTGDYDDLINKPVIPDVSNYYTKTETDNAIDDGIEDYFMEQLPDFTVFKMRYQEDHIGSLAVTTSAGNLYRSAEQTFNFSGFTTVKAIFVTGSNATGSTSSWVAVTSKTNTSVRFVVMRYNSATLSDYTVSFLIVGV